MKFFNVHTRRVFAVLKGVVGLHTMCLLFMAIALCASEGEAKVT